MTLGGIAGRAGHGRGRPASATDARPGRHASARAAGPRAGPRSRWPSSTARSALLLSLIEARQLDVLTVPLGALADAYLDALGRLEADRLGNVSSFVAIASQLILIKSRAMLPRRTDPTDPTGARRRRHGPRGRAARPAAPLPRLPRRGPAPGRAGARRGSGCSGASRRRPTPRRSPAPRPLDAPPLDPRRLVRALDRLAAIAPPPEPPPEAHGPDDHDHRARRDHPGGPARRADGRPPGPARRACATGSSSRSRSWPCSS